MWIVSQPAAMGEGGFTEFGKFDHGFKYGPWYKIDEQGDLTAMETFRNNVLDGEVKYFIKGRLSAVGYYKGLNPETEYDTIMVEDPVTGQQILRAVHNERNTVRHGPWRFYDVETGRLVREEEYQVDSLINSKEFPMSKADSLYYQKRESQMPHNKKKGVSGRRMTLYK
jgi:antitoxin component YwqK of YwqJK toxin-antitoxin module